MSRLVLTNVNLLDGDNPSVPNRTIAVDGDRIASVDVAAPAAQPGDRVVDLGGRTLMPGMATCHFHATYKDVGRNASGAPYGYEYPPAYQALIAYKNLTAVERDFRTLKTTDLDLRPIHHRLEDRVRGHVFIATLAAYLT